MIPRIIWMYWDEKQTPLIKAIIQHNQKVLHNWDLRILNKTTIHRYIKEFPKEYPTLSVQQQSDWMRLYLIMTYGGIWSDASIIYNDASKVEELWGKSVDYDYVGFFNNGVLNNASKYPNIETWFFVSDKQGQLVTLWFHEYTKAIKEGFVNYVHRILKEGTNLDRHYHGTDMYFIVYMCLQHIVQHPHPKIPMLLLNAFDSMFYLNKRCMKQKNREVTESICIMNDIKTKPYVKKIPFIKLTRHERGTNINILPYFRNRKNTRKKMQRK